MTTKAKAKPKSKPKAKHAPRQTPPDADPDAEDFPLEVHGEWTDHHTRLIAQLLVDLEDAPTGNPAVRSK